MQSSAYVAMLSGWLLVYESGTAVKLRQIAHASKLQLAEDERYTNRLRGNETCRTFSLLEEEHGIEDEAELRGHSSHPHFALRREWHLRFKGSTRRQRIAMRVCCALCSSLMILLLILITMSVLFTTRCSSLSVAETSSAYAIEQPQLDDGIVNYQFISEYKTGSLILKQGNATQGNIQVYDYAIKVRCRLEMHIIL